MTDELSIVTPGSVTDVAKAIREMMKALADLRKIAIGAADLYDQRKARRAAGNLAKLAFSKAGMRGPLERIAAGAGSPRDFEDIAARLAATADEIKDSFTALTKYKDRLRELYGLPAAMEIDAILYGPAFGKEMIRYSLQQLVTSQNRSASADVIQREAQSILSHVEELNNHLIELHNMLVPPRKQNSKAKVRKNQP